MDINPLSKNFLYKGVGIVLMQLDEANPAELTHMGLCKDFSFKHESDVEEISSPCTESGEVEKVAELPLSTKVEGKFTTLSWTDENLALAVGGDATKNTVAANALFTATFEDVKVGKHYDLGRAVTGLTVTDGSDPSVEYVAGEHYRIFAGRTILILATPAGADGTLEVAGNADAIANTEIGIADKSARVGRLLFIGTEAGKAPMTVEINRASVKCNEDISMLDGTKAQELPFTISIEPVPELGKFRFGKVTRG